MLSSTRILNLPHLFTMHMLLVCWHADYTEILGKKECSPLANIQCDFKNHLNEM